MATLTVQSVTESGLDGSYSAAAGAGDTFVNDTTGRTFLHVKNGDASSHTVTVTPVITSRSIEGFGTLTKSGVSVAIPAGEDRFIGPFPYTAYGADPDITYSAVTSVTVAAIKV